jgi:hypothetical protein
MPLTVTHSCPPAPPGRTGTRQRGTPVRAIREDSLVFAKSIPGLALAPPAWRHERMSAARFLLLDTLGSFVWAASFTGTGYIFGGVIEIGSLPAANSPAMPCGIPRSRRCCQSVLCPTADRTAGSPVVRSDARRGAVADPRPLPSGSPAWTREGGRSRVYPRAR